MKTLLEVAKNLIFFKNEKSSSEIKNLNIKSSSDIVKQIHEDFFTEVDKLLEEVKISKTVKLSIEMATPEQLKELEELEVNFDGLCKAFKLSHLNELTFEMAEKAIAKKKEQK